jgi:hypothetical protein
MPRSRGVRKVCHLNEVRTARTLLSGCLPAGMLEFRVLVLIPTS